MSYIVGRINGISSAVKRHGILNYLGRLISTYSGKLYRVHDATVFRRQLAEPVELIAARVEMDIRPCEEGQRGELLDFLGQFERRDDIQKKLRDGWEPMLGYFLGELRSVSWFSRQPIYVGSIELILDYGDGAAYIEGSRTDKILQGKGVATSIRAHICHYLRQQGVETVYVCAGDDNTASQTVARKCGFLPFEKIRLTTLLMWRRHSRQIA